MTQPIVINFPPLTIGAIVTESTTVIPAGSPFPLNGGSITNIFSGETQYFYKLDPGVAIKPYLYSSAGVDWSGAEITISGYDNYNQFVEITVNGPAARQDIVVDEYFHEIIQIIADVDINDLSVGLSANGLIDVQTDYYNKSGQYSLQITDFDDATRPELTLNYSSYQPTVFTNGEYIYHEGFDLSFEEIPLLNDNVIVSPSTITTYPIGNVVMVSLSDMAISAFRIYVDFDVDPILEGYGNFRFTFLQQGAHS